jgi:hypothetical protein
MGITCSNTCSKLFEDEEDWPVADYSTMNSSAAADLSCVWSPTRPISPVESLIEQQYMSPPTSSIDLHSPGVTLISSQPRQQIIENQKSEVDRKRSYDSLPQLNESYEDEQEEQENMDNANTKKLPAVALVQCLGVDLVGVKSAPLALTPSTTLVL